MKNTINELERIIREYSPRLKQLKEPGCSFKPSSSKWSGKEYLGHLIDSAQNNIRRFVVAQYENAPHIIYRQEQWVAAANYQQYPVSDLVDLWILINKHMAIILKNLPDEMYQREVRTEDLHTIQWLAADYNKHLLHHLHGVGFGPADAAQRGNLRKVESGELAPRNRNGQVRSIAICKAVMATECLYLPTDRGTHDPVAYARQGIKLSEFHVSPYWSDNSILDETFAWWLWGGD